MKIKIRYNAPVILTFAIAASVIMLLSVDFRRNYFGVPSRFEIYNPVWYFRLVSYCLGHFNWAHLAGNFALILLIGPLMEEKYGSRRLLAMIIGTVVVTGLLNAMLFSDILLMGASGVAFMLIVLSSFANFRAGEIPLTFILIAIIFVGSEVTASFSEDNVSQFAHIAGGLIGGALGFALAKRGETTET